MPSDLPPVDPDEGLDKFPRHRLQLQGKKHQGRLGVCRLRGVPVPRARYEVGGIVLADQNLMKDCGVSADMVAVAQNDALDERICRLDQLDRHGWFSWLVFETLWGFGEAIMRVKVNADNVAARTEYWNDTY